MRNCPEEKGVSGQILNFRLNTTVWRAEFCPNLKTIKISSCINMCHLNTFGNIHVNAIYSCTLNFKF